VLAEIPNRMNLLYTLTSPEWIAKYLTLYRN
jgi:hypothetical protein